MATYPQPSGSLDALLTVADAALYAAKYAGRDRVALDTAPTAPTASPHAREGSVGDGG